MNNKKNDLIRRITDVDIINFLRDHDNSKFDSQALQDYINDDNKDYEDFLHTKYIDARQRIYEVYLANRFVELYRIEPVNNFTRVTFYPSKEEYYLNIPAYFKTNVNEKILPKPAPFVYVKFPPVDPKKIPGVHIIEDEALMVELD